MAGLSIDPGAAHTAAPSDICETAKASTVEEGVQETEGLEAFGEAGVVEEANDPCEYRASGGCSTRAGEGVVGVDCVTGW